MTPADAGTTRGARRWHPLPPPRYLRELDRVAHQGGEPYLSPRRKPDRLLARPFRALVSLRGENQERWPGNRRPRRAIGLKNGGPLQHNNFMLDNVPYVNADDVYSDVTSLGKLYEDQAAVSCGGG